MQLEDGKEFPGEPGPGGVRPSVEEAQADEADEEVDLMFDTYLKICDQTCA